MLIVPDGHQAQTLALGIIERGGVIAFRTDTFYGLGADPFQTLAIQKIKKLKGREDPKPILIVISDRDQVKRFIQDPSSTFLSLCERFWPGALTLIGRARKDVPADITAGTGTVGLRLPNDVEARELVRACGGALTATSANPANESPSRTAQAVKAYFTDGVELIIDGGPARTERPSTVVDATADQPVLVREGEIEWEAISMNLR